MMQRARVMPTLTMTMTQTMMPILESTSASLRASSERQLSTTNRNSQPECHILEQLLLPSSDWRCEVVSNRTIYQNLLPRIPNHITTHHARCLSTTMPERAASHAPHFTLSLSSLLVLSLPLRLRAPSSLPTTPLFLRTGAPAAQGRGEEAASGAAEPGEAAVDLEGWRRLERGGAGELPGVLAGVPPASAHASPGSTSAARTHRLGCSVNNRESCLSQQQREKERARAQSSQYQRGARTALLSLEASAEPPARSIRGQPTPNADPHGGIKADQPQSWYRLYRKGGDSQLNPPSTSDTRHSLRQRRGAARVSQASSSLPACARTANVGTARCSSRPLTPAPAA